MRLRLAVGWFLAIVCAMPAPVSASHFGPYPAPDTQVWPGSGTATPDLPFSSTFGPRQKSSEQSRYDWHRGADIPLPCYTPLHAIAAGVVRMSGDYAQYSDRVVQVCHPKPGFGLGVCGTDSNGDGLMDDLNGDGIVDGAASANAYYTTYIHVAQATLPPGTIVTQGQIVAQSGESLIGYTGVCHPDDQPSPGGFDHLHFEIRDGGVTQKSCVHPLLVLPYPDAGPPAVTIASVDAADPMHPIVKVTVTTTPMETDLESVEVIVYDRSTGTPVEVDRHLVDLMEWTYLYSADVATLDTAPAYDGVYDDPVVFGTDSGVTMQPAEYHAYSAEYSIDFTFTSLSGAATAPALAIVARATDVRGNTVQTTKNLAPRGDVNGDGSVTVGDVFYLINYLFANGGAPLGPGDANGDNAVSVGDVFFLINYLFANGPAPSSTSAPAQSTSGAPILGSITVGSARVIPGQRRVTVPIVASGDALDQVALRVVAEPGDAVESIALNLNRPRRPLFETSPPRHTRWHAGQGSHAYQVFTWLMFADVRTAHVA